MYGDVETTIPQDPDPILVNGIRVFTPNEIARMRSVMLERHRIVFDAALFTGMRHLELVRLADAHCSWFDERRENIRIPASAVEKVKVRIKERTIPLSYKGVQAMIDLRNLSQAYQVPLRASWGATIRKAATDAKLRYPNTVVPKSTRKTWESWLLAVYPNAGMTIVRAMGHTTTTAIQHYIDIGFDLNEKQQIKPFVDGFIREV